MWTVTGTFSQSLLWVKASLLFLLICKKKTPGVKLTSLLCKLGRETTAPPYRNSVAITSVDIWQRLAENENREHSKITIFPPRSLNSGFEVPPSFWEGKGLRKVKHVLQSNHGSQAVPSFPEQKCPNQGFSEAYITWLLTSKIKRFYFEW